MRYKNKFLYCYQKFFCRKVFYRLHTILFRLALRGIGVLNISDDISGEKFYLNLFLKNKKNPIIFDVGANIGNYSQMVKIINTSAIVYSFEPHPTAFKKLQLSAEQYHFKAFELAIGGVNGILSLYDYKDNPGSEHASFFKTVITNRNNSTIEEVSVPVTTLDDFCLNNNVCDIYILKIDVEGSEFNILQGAERLIHEKRISIIAFEFNEMNIVSRVFLKDFFSILANYTFFKLLQDGLIPFSYESLYEIFAYQNIIAIHNDFLKEAKYV